MIGAAGEVGGANRPLIGNMPQQVGDLLLMILHPLGVIFPAKALGFEHAVAQQPVIFARNKAGFVRPVFKQLALRQRLFQPARRVAAEAAEQHQIRAAGDDVNGIDLQQRHAPYRREQIRIARAFRRRAQQTLRRQMKISSLLKRKRKRCVHSLPAFGERLVCGPACALPRQTFNIVQQRRDGAAAQFGFDRQIPPVGLGEATALNRVFFGHQQGLALDH